mgnify:CR=1 FL=1
MDLQGFFDLNKNEERKRWEFTPKETELCDNPNCEDGVADRDMYGHPIYCQVCDKHN